MATIDMRRKHTMTKDEARQKAEQLARDMEQKLGLRWQWQGDEVVFDAPSGAAKGTTGKVSVTSDEVRVQIDLPFLLRAIKGTVEGKVKNRLDEIVGPA